jgi:hypothetical protein
VTIVELHISFTCIEMRHKEMMHNGMQFFLLTKLIPKPEFLTLNLAFNCYGMNILKSFILSNQMIQYISNFSLRMDWCNLKDSDMMMLHMCNQMPKLETFEISLEKNSLTNATHANFLVMTRLKNLKDFKIFLGGNSIDEDFVKKLSNEFRLIKFKLIDKL